MRQSTRLVVNTVATFGRMALTVGVGLVTTRLFLEALGEVNFGLLSVLGATGTMLRLTTIALTASTQRHLAYEIGRGDKQAMATVFSTALTMFGAVGIALWVIGQGLVPVIMRWLIIPPDRADAAWWVYQFTLLGIASSVILTPYHGIIAAHQELVISSVVDLISSVLRLLIAVALFLIAADRLIAFSAMDYATSTGVMILLVGLCLRRYPESRPNWRWVRLAEMRRLAAYAGWSIMGTLAGSLRHQGGVILLNLRFGPIVNAAFAISEQIIGYVTHFTGSLTRVVRPAIVVQEARQRRAQVHQLALVTGKYSLLVLMGIFIPIWLDADLILRLWLGELPPHTVILVRLGLIWSLLLQLATGHHLALQATGDIGWYTRIVLGLAVATLVAAGVGFYVFGTGPWALPAAMIMTTVAMVAVAVVMIGRRIELPPRVWLRRMVWRVACVVVPATGAALVVNQLVAPTPWRILATAGVYAMLAVPLMWHVALEGWEKEHFRRIASRFGRRVGTP
ncbi:MAG: lipopolysaccharide biosynthesis protein [Gammaproteobacteria bacterium]